VTQKSGAFTLIELLAAIGILAVLATILISVIGGARNAANDARCRVNLRQIYTGWMSYCAETRLLPCRWNPSGMSSYQAGDPDPRTNEVRWQVNLRSYLGLPTVSAYASWMDSFDRVPEFLGPLCCPSDKRKNSGTVNEAEYTKKYGIGHINGIDNSSYGNNLFLEHLTKVNGNRTTRAVEITKNPILLIDALFRSVSPDPSLSGSSLRQQVRFRHGASDDYDIDADKAWPNDAPLQGGHANAVHQDGMVRSYKEDTLPTATMLGTNPPKPASCQTHPKSKLNGYDLWVPWDTQ
jgi:prepilin-type N-terminal cleavage/methylation domain-containing protein